MVTLLRGRFEAFAHGRGQVGQRVLRALTKVTLRTPPLVSEPMVIPCPVPMMLLDDDSSDESAQDPQL